MITNILVTKIPRKRQKIDEIIESLSHNNNKIKLPRITDADDLVL